MQSRKRILETAFRAGCRSGGGGGRPAQDRLPRRVRAVYRGHRHPNDGIPFGRRSRLAREIRGAADGSALGVPAADGAATAQSDAPRNCANGPRWKQFAASLIGSRPRACAVLARLDRVARGRGPVDPVPSVRSEAVAPYVPPETPATRSLSSDEAQAVLRRDWLFQADENPSPARIRREIGWTRRLAARIERTARGTVHLAGPLAELQPLEGQAKALTKASPELYFQVRQVKRRDHACKSGPAIRQDPAGGHALPAGERMAARDAAPAGLHGGARRPAAGTRRIVTRRPVDPAHAPIAAARVVLAARRLVRRQEGALLLQAAQRESRSICTRSMPTART